MGMGIELFKIKEFYNFDKNVYKIIKALNLNLFF